MMRHLLAVCVCVLASAAVCVAADPPAAPLADKLPGDCVAYVAWAGRTPAMAASNAGRLLKEPGFQEIIETAKKVLLSHAPEGKQRQAAEHAVALAEILWERPAALAVTSLPKGDGPPAGLLLIDLGSAKAEFEKHFAGLVASAEEGKIKQQTVAGTDATILQLPAGPLFCGFKGDTFVAALGQELFEQNTSGPVGKAPASPLSANAQFQKALAAVGGADAQVIMYVDAAKLIAWGEAMAGQQARPRPATGDDVEPAPAPQPGGPLRAILQAVGVDRATAYVSAARFVPNGGTLTRTKLLSPAPHQGFLKLLAGRPLEDADLATAPADTIVMGAVNISASDFYHWMRGLMRAIDPAAEKDMLQGVAEADKDLGISIEKDLLASLDDTWMLTSAESLGGLVTGTVLSVKVKDVPRLQAAIGKIVGAAGTPESMPAGEDVMSPRNFGHSSLPSVHSVAVGQTKIQYLSLPGRESFVAPAWAIHDGRLYVAAWPQVVHAAIDRANSKADRPANAAPAFLTASPKFQQVRKLVAAKPSAIFYADAPELARRVIPALLPGWSLGSMYLGRMGVAQSPVDWLPTLQRIEGYVQPCISAVSSDADGILLEEYTGLPMAGAEGLPVAVGVGMSALQEARANAQTAMSAANLKSIGMAIAMYQADNNDRMPADLGLLMKHGQLSNTMIFIHPTSRTAPPKVADGKLVGEIDYVYVGPLDIAKAGGQDVLAYEKLRFARNGRVNVLFPDWSVCFITVQELAAKLKAQNLTPVN